MATYKKRGYKPKTQKEKNEAIEEQSTTAEVFNTLDESASKTEEWVAKNQNYIFGVVAAIAVVILGYLGYQKYILEPKQEEAMNEMFKAQQYFDQAVNGVESDSLFNMTLSGGEGKFGMLDIVEEYNGTPAANLANYYAGMSYLNLKDYPNAIKYLTKFKSDDLMLNPIAKGAIGDAFVQINQPNDALEYYEKAIAASANDFTTPLYLSKAGKLALSLDKNDKALKFFERIKTEFSTSTEAASIDVFIAKAKAKL
jgi:tetratricopeptide (TPR) repeat protein